LAARTPFQATDQANDQCQPQRADRVRHVSLRPHRPRAGGNLRIGQAACVAAFFLTQALPEQETIGGDAQTRMMMKASDLIFYSSP